MAEPVRERLLDAYNVFLDLAFDDEFIRATETPMLSNTNNSKNSDRSWEGGKDKLLDDKVQKMINNGKGRDNSYFAAPERFSKCEPGGKPWRKNLIESNLEN